MKITELTYKLKQIQEMIDEAECREDLNGIKGFIDDEIISKLDITARLK